MVSSQQSVSREQCQQQPAASRDCSPAQPTLRTSVENFLRFPNLFHLTKFVVFQLIIASVIADTQQTGYRYYLESWSQC